MTSGQRAGAALIALGTTGLAASLALTIERFRLTADPGYVPSCNLNPILSCGSVMSTPQASAFGFPNPLIGLIGFTVVGMTGMLLAGAVRLPRWYLIGLAATTLLATVFIHWLIFQSLYRIGALCPYCMVVWVVTVPSLAITASLASDRASRWWKALVDWRWPIVAAWFALVIVLIYLRFDSYWNTLLP